MRRISRLLYKQLQTGIYQVAKTLFICRPPPSVTHSWLLTSTTTSSRIHQTANPPNLASSAATCTYFVTCTWVSNCPPKTSSSSRSRPCVRSKPTPSWLPSSGHLLPHSKTTFASLLLPLQVPTHYTNYTKVLTLVIETRGLSEVSTANKMTSKSEVVVTSRSHVHTKVQCRCQRSVSCHWIRTKKPRQVCS